MPQDYRPELDESQELDTEGITMYQELMGILRWAVEIGRVDILTKLSMLSPYQAAPREGHLERLINIFAFIKKKPKLMLFFDPTIPRLEAKMFNGSTSEQFRERYRDAKEEVSMRIPKPRGRSIHMTTFMDASHAANKVNWRSHTGFIIFIN